MKTKSKAATKSSTRVDPSKTPKETPKSNPKNTVAPAPAPPPNKCQHGSDPKKEKNGPLERNMFSIFEPLRAQNARDGKHRRSVPKNPPQHPQKLSKQKNKFGNRRPNKQTVLKKRSLSNYKITDLFESVRPKMQQSSICESILEDILWDVILYDVASKNELRTTN